MHTTIHQRVATRSNPAAGGIASLLVALATTLSAQGDITRNYNGPSNFNVTITNMPDLDQRRAHNFMGTITDPFDDIIGLPGDGGMYCAPTSAMNLLVYAANHGFPALEPGIGTWSTPSSYNGASIAILQLGSLMDTDPEDGTSGDGQYDGISEWLNDSNMNAYLYVLSRKRSGSDYPRLHDLASQVNAGGIVSFCYGRYQLGVSIGGIPIVGRNGGHCVSMVKAARSDDNAIIKYRDPATDSANLYAQSGWADRGWPIVDRAVFSESIFDLAVASEMVTGLNDGKIRLIDGFVSLRPRWMASYKNDAGQPAPAIVIRRPISIANPPADPPTFVDLTGVLNDLAIDDARQQGFGLSSTNGGPNVLVRLDINTGAPTPLPNAPTGLLDVIVTRRGELIAHDGSKLYRLDQDGNITAATSAIANPTAIAMDDDKDQVVVLSATERRLTRIADTLSGPTTSLIVPNGIPLGGTEELSIDHTDNGRAWFATKNGSTLYGIGSGALAVDVRTIALPAVQAIRDVAFDESGRMYVSNAGSIDVLVRDGVTWSIDLNSPFQGLEAGDGLFVGHGRTNFDPSEMSGPAWNNLEMDSEPASVETPDCPGDLDMNGIVDGLDLAILLGAWGSPQVDLNGDGLADGSDLGLLLGAWGSCN